MNATGSEPGQGHSIRVASRLTGIPVETLRMWERRYGFPRPARREGSNRRLYSPEDVERLVWVARALQQGYRAGDVIHKAADELRGILERTAGDRPVWPSGGSETGLVERLLERLARDDLGAVEGELRLAAAALGPRRFVVEVAHPLLVAVGQSWEDGRLEVRQEHALSQALRTQLRVLLAGFQDLEGRPVVLLATLPGELHELGLDMAALVLATSSAKPRLLGGNTPPAEIVEAARVLQADVVGLTITGAMPPDEARQAILGLLDELPRRVPIWVGGAAAERLDLEPGAVELVGDWDALDRALRGYRESPARRS